MNECRHAETHGYCIYCDLADTKQKLKDATEHPWVTWISVEDRLPEDASEVNIVLERHDGSRCSTTAICMSVTKRWMDTSGDEYNGSAGEKVILWQPLPPPPEEK